MPVTLPGSIDVVIDINHDSHFDAIKARDAGVLCDAVQAHGADPILKNCPLWYARYRNQPIGIPTDTWPHFILWQYTDGKSRPLPHVFAGMEPSDRDCYAGTEAQRKAAWPFADYFKTAPRSTDQNA